MTTRRNQFDQPKIEYVKRLRMMVDLTEQPEVLRLPITLPPGFFWVPWHPCLTDIHGRVKYLSFRDSIDAFVFPTFTRFDACLNLMRTIAGHPGFVPSGTWLIGYSDLDARSESSVGPDSGVPEENGSGKDRGSEPDRSPSREWPILRHPEKENIEFCATIQGIRSTPEICAIQNVAVRPEFQRRGLGRALVLKALAGFHTAGIRKVTLEATAQNYHAIRLYEKIGFHVYQTVYKETFVPR